LNKLSKKRKKKRGKNESRWDIDKMINYHYEGMWKITLLVGYNPHRCAFRDDIAKKRRK
jgi:hypothetical protein